MSGCAHCTPPHNWPLSRAPDRTADLVRTRTMPQRRPDDRTTGLAEGWGRLGQWANGGNKGEAGERRRPLSRWRRTWSWAAGQDGGRALWPPEGGSPARIEADNAHGSSRAPGWKGQRQLTEKRKKGQSWGSLENRKGGGGSISWTGGKIFWKRRRRADNEFAASLQAADCGRWGKGGTRASHASPALIILMPSRPPAL